VGFFTAMLLSMALQPAAPPDTVPVRQEPMHHLKMENESVRVFDVVVPPGQSTLYHLHAADYVFVTLGAADVRSEPVGAAPAELKLADGETRFTKAPLTHRASNLAPTPFRNLTIEVLKTGGAANLPPLPGGYSPVLENEKVRVSRLVLDPGQSMDTPPTAPKTLQVVVAPSRLLEDAGQGKPGRTGDTKAGDFQWRQTPRRHSMRNVGTTRFEAVLIEWK
jgi:quercetin dioxygenase-like cupin family protein